MDSQGPHKLEKPDIARGPATPSASEPKTENDGEAESGDEKRKERAMLKQEMAKLGQPLNQMMPYRRSQPKGTRLRLHVCDSLVQW
jgi:hypothetical protein